MCDALVRASGFRKPRTDSVLSTAADVVRVIAPGRKECESGTDAPGDGLVNPSVAINYGGATTDPQPAKNRGTTIQVNRKTGKVSYVAGGLRTPDGIGWGPGGDRVVPCGRAALLHLCGVRG
ncbi:hypothetical protein ACIQ7Q_21165 [Streptomyces sp. NPDC096176]|uniref:hypothetical protein n=1 Tax=Streptomyces sp. NPDC096176 TaxID=3366079 RepID=UPI0037F3040C